MATTKPIEPAPTFLTLPCELRQQILLDSYTPQINADWEQTLWERSDEPQNTHVKGWTSVLMSAFPTIKDDISYVGDISSIRSVVEFRATRKARSRMLSRCFRFAVRF
ncbi:hypothetical protein BLS_003785 [Venturia inaequalis]|uniref:Uncharacterized protein n=1 Tax=Venturia inaequalis TaxID=5025 RepID=A0A8H3UP17_VENIN|nr:hypothetical protein BLS_003785 [Venturia inaequalis]